jgi:hypothetical protein
MLKPAIAASAAVVFAFCFTSLGIRPRPTAMPVREPWKGRSCVVPRRPPGGTSPVPARWPWCNWQSSRRCSSSAHVARSNGQRLEPRPLPRPAPWLAPPGHHPGHRHPWGRRRAPADRRAGPGPQLSGANGWTLAWWMGLDGRHRCRHYPHRVPAGRAGHLRLVRALLTGVVRQPGRGLRGPVWSWQARVGRAIALIALAPLGVSAATIGLGTLLAYGRAPADLRGTGLLVPLRPCPGCHSPGRRRRGSRPAQPPIHD